MTTSIYKRVVLKISGEGLAPAEGFGISADALHRVAGEICAAHALGVQIAVVVGGGNVVRGSTFVKQCKIAEATAHHMGMLATVINALALQETLEAAGTHAITMSSVAIASICEPYVRRHCLAHMAKGRVVVLAAGTGRPFVTTDTAAALASAELGADALLKATQVDGLYDADPRVNPKAVLLPKATYEQVINQRLKVMDIAAIEMCERTGVVVRVFNLHQPGNIRRIIAGEPIGSIIGASA